MACIPRVSPDLNAAYWWDKRRFSTLLGSYLVSSVWPHCAKQKQRYFQLSFCLPQLSGKASQTKTEQHGLENSAYLTNVLC